LRGILNLLATFTQLFATNITAFQVLTKSLQCVKVEIQILTCKSLDVNIQS